MSAFAPAFGLLLGLSLACGGLGGNTSRSSSYSRSEPPASGAEGYAALDQGYRVAPDRAVLAVTVNVEGGDYAAASGMLTTEVTALEQLGNDLCTMTVLDYAAPTGADSSWTAVAEVRVDVDLRGLGGVSERRSRIETCLGSLVPRLTESWSDASSGRRLVRASTPVLEVDAPDKHRDALLDRERTRLVWAASAAGAPQLHPTDLRCVPNGSVIVRDRRLSGILLGLDMPCHVEPTGGPERIAVAD